MARIICGSQCPDSGEVLLDGKRLLGTYRKRSPEELADIQYIFQDPYSAVGLTNTLRQTLGETERVMKRRSASADLHCQSPDPQAEASDHRRVYLHAG